jgi:hypothetical protein
MRYYTSLCLIILAFPLLAQDLTQRVKGRVVDVASEKGLSGASVLISNAVVSSGTVTDSDGNFTIEKVPPGRYRLQVNFVGYGMHEDELLVISGREAIIRVQLAETPTVLGEVAVSGVTLPAEAGTGIHTISIEKTMRIPANFFDPVRMTTSYPSVVAANDQANAIIVKGNSPNGLLWRLNEVDIVNPNHLANAGTLSDRPMANGGGVNILSAQMLDRTNFYTGAFPTSFGNALSGVLDMKLREGNADKTEFTAQASLIGLDVSAEGPLSKNNRHSFLANYRYSTVGLLSKLGVQFGDEDITFQDFSYHLNFHARNGATFSFFGLFGNSVNDFAAKPRDEWEEDKDKYNIRYTSRTYAVGGNYVKPLPRGNFFVGLAYSSNNQNRNASASHEVDDARLQLLQDEYSSARNLLSTHIRYEYKPGVGAFQVGVLANYQEDDLNVSRLFGFPPPFPPISRRESLRGAGDGILFQPYANWLIPFSDQWRTTTGIRYVYYTFNNTSSVEPRLALDYVVNSKSTASVSYRLTSQLQQTGTYFNSGNRFLDLTRAHHIEGGYRHQLSSNTRLTTEVFYQYLFDVPVESDPASTFSVLNLLEGVALPDLVSAGTGENYGVNALVEKSFFQRHYFLLGGSYYESKYTAADGIKRNTRFNGNYTLNATYGKEWHNDERHRVIGLNLRGLFLGAMRESTINEGHSVETGETAFDQTNPFNHKLADYFRLDLRLSFRKNKPGYTRTFALDIQNVLNTQNEAFRYYDFVQNQVVTKYQLGIIPVLVYRIDF